MPLTPAKTPSFKPRQILAIAVGAVVVGAGLAAGVSLAAGWSEGRALTNAATMAALVWLAATVVGTQVLVVGTGLSVDRLGMGILASSMARMLAALVLGVIAFFLLGPSGLTYWVCFLAAGLSVLIAEACWSIHTIKGAARTVAPPEQGAA